MKILFWLVLSLWIGGHAFFSFVIGPRLFAALSRPEAGRAVAAIFPAYFTMGAICGAVILMLTILNRNAAWAPGKMGVLLAGAALGLTLLGGLVLQPKLHDLRTQIYAGAEPLPEGDPVRKSFAKWHGVSLLINFGVLISGIALIARTAAK